MALSCGVSFSGRVPVHSRYFFINMHYGGCDSDIGWLVAVGFFAPRVPCNWEDFSSYPTFMYSTATTATLWKGNGE